MGMMFGGWVKDEEERFKASGLTREEFKTKEKHEYDNKNLSYYKKIARFKGIELQEGDMISKDLDSDIYVINDFQEDGRPICTLVTNKRNDFWKKPYPYEEVLLISANLNL